MHSSRPYILSLDRRCGAKLPLDSQVPNFVVLDGKIVIDAVGADRPGRVEGQNVFCLVRGRWSRIADGLEEEKWNILGQVLKNAVRSLIGIDSKARANHSLACPGNTPRQPNARGQTQILGR